MSLYRKRPVVVEARHFDVPPDRLPMALGIELAKWCGGQFMTQLVGRADPRIEIPTLEGVMTARLGDWIIKGTAGEFYPIKPEIFAETYEPADVDEPDFYECPEHGETFERGGECAQCAQAVSQ